MISLPHLLRVASLLASASWNLVSEDPRGFAGKLAERIRQSDNPVLSALPSGPLARVAAAQTSRARQLIDAGHLTAGVRHVAAQGASASGSDIHLAKRTLERLEQLTTPPLTEGPTTPPTAGEHRVLHVLTNSKPFTQSGYTVRSHHVLQCQQAAGIYVEAVTRLGYPILVGKISKSPEQTINDVTYRRLLPWIYPFKLVDRNERAIRAIVRRARKMQATILHTTTDYTNAVVVAEAAKRLGIPWVYEVRGELESTWLARQPQERQQDAEASEFYRLARDQETRCMKAAHAVVTLSEISKRQLVERGIPAEKITVVPNAVDDADIGRKFDQKAIRRDLGLDEDAVWVGTATAVVDYEGLDTLIAALKYLPREYKVLIVGDGTARPKLEEYAQHLGVAERVRFAGRQPSEDIWRWYAALDVFAVPRKDTKVTRTVTPIKPLTAMALGIPVVASDLPALREVTGERAEYVDPENSAALARGIHAAGKTQQHGTEWARSRTWSENGLRYRALYDALVDPKAE